ncbi:MAG TPA: helix-turn-helix domain-containing protein [Polyangiaceae bacterium]
MTEATPTKPHEPLILIQANELTRIIRQAVEQVLDARGYQLEYELLSRSQVAALFRCTERTIHNWVKRDGMPHRRTGNGRLVFDRKAVAEWAHAAGRPMAGV